MVGGNSLTTALFGLGLPILAALLERLFGHEGTILRRVCLGLHFASPFLFVMSLLYGIIALNRPSIRPRFALASGDQRSGNQWADLSLRSVRVRPVPVLVDDVSRLEELSSTTALAAPHRSLAGGTAGRI